MQTESRILDPGSEGGGGEWPEANCCFVSDLRIENMYTS